MKSLMIAAGLAAGVSFVAAPALAQTGVLSKAVGGYTFEDAAKEAPATKGFNSKDG